MRSGPVINGFYYWPSTRRSRWRWIISRRSCHHHQDGPTEESTSMYQHRHEHICDQCLHWTGHWGRIYAIRHMALVLLDVSITHLMTLSRDLEPPNHIDYLDSNVPIGAVVLVLIFFIFHPPKESHASRERSATLTTTEMLLKLDPLGCLFIMSATVCILLAFQWGGQSMPWNSPTVIGLLVAFPLILCLFALAQWRQGEDSIFPPWLMRQRSIIAGCIFSFFLSMPSYVVSSKAPHAPTQGSIHSRLKDERYQADDPPVRVLPSNLLSGCQRVNGNAKRDTISRPRHTADVWSCHHRCTSDCLWILCESPDTYPPVIPIKALRLL